MAQPREDCVVFFVAGQYPQGHMTGLLVTVVYINIISGNLDAALTANQQLLDVSTKSGYTGYG